MSSAWFVTGTDTGVGKTRVACALLAAAAARGIGVAGLKPISCGLEPGPDGPRHADALALMAAASVELPYAMVNPYAFAPPIAPHIASEEVGIQATHGILIQLLGDEIPSPSVPAKR